MATNDGSNLDSQPVAAASGNSSSAGYDGPTMFYRALIKEYEETKIFETSDGEAVIKNYRRRKEKLKVLNYLNTLNLPLEERQRQFRLRQYLNQ